MQGALMSFLASPSQPPRGAWKTGLGEQYLLITALSPFSSPPFPRVPVLGGSREKSGHHPKQNPPASREQFLTLHRQRTPLCYHTAPPLTMVPLGDCLVAPTPKAGPGYGLQRE